MQEQIGRVFIAFAISRLQDSAKRVDDCLARLSEEQIWWRGGEGQNAVGNLVLHLCGNIRQWVVGAIGGAPDIRDRPGEFAARGGESTSVLRERLRDTLSEAVEVLDDLPPSRLQERVTVQIYDRSILEVIFTVVAHFAEHTGQIVFVTKMLTGQDLGYSTKVNQAAAKNSIKVSS